MARPLPPLVRLSDMLPNQSGDFFALLAERTRGAGKNGKPYYTCRFRDARRTVTFMVWGDSSWFEECEQQWKESHFYKIRGTFDEHEAYGPQIQVQNLRPLTDADKADGFNLVDFIECSRFNREEMFSHLRSLAESRIGDDGLRRLVLTILDRHAEPLKLLPATLRNFYPFCGGLLEHILSVTHTCLHLVEQYQTHYPDLQPALNRDLVVAGAILHDMGRVVEFNSDPVQVQQTVPGRMFGHLFLGRDLVRDTARELGDVNPELLQLLEHLIITHLNLPEWGSPRLPLIPESLILHHADDLDAKMEMYIRCLNKDQEAGPFTARDPVLGRQLYKGRSV